MTTADPGTSPPQLWIAVGGVAIFSIAWMLTLVPFARAVLGRTPRAHAKVRVKSVVHGLACGGLAGCIAWLVSQGTAAHALENYLLAAAFLFGLPIAESALLWFGRSLRKTQARPLSGGHTPQPAPASAARDEVAAGPTAPWRRPISGAILLGTVLLLAWFAQTNRYVRAYSLSLHGHAALLLWTVVPVTICGFVAFMIGGLRFVLTTGRPTSREDVATLTNTAKLVGASYLRGSFKHRVFGDAIGSQSNENLSLSAVKRAWRARTWKGSPPWQGIFLMLGGGLIAVFAGLGMVVVTAPPYVQLIVAAAQLYAAARLTLAWRRA